MANRVVLGKDGSDYCLKVSEPGDNVLSPSEPLIFDSTVVRTGQVYAGGNSSSLSSSGVDWSATKGQLGYIPLVTQTNDDNGNKMFYNTTILEEYIDYYGACRTTLTSLIPSVVDDGVQDVSHNNVFFMVLRIPMQYGKMTDSSLWD